MITAKIAAALATGNTCIIKPPTLVSLPALKIAEILSECEDLPKGVVNIITGPGNPAGEALAGHPGVDMVAFTGGYETGKAIMTAAGRTVKPVFLELGGKNPFIVLEDADLDEAVPRAVSSITFNSGMVCGSTGRFYVHKDLYDEFVERFLLEIRKVTVGNPADPKTQMGPVVSAEHRERVENYITIGKEEGANLIYGENRTLETPLDKGYFVLPAVFTHVGQHSRLGREEIFGPVACIMEPFTSEEEVIRLANDTPFGLTATVWTRNTARGIRIANKIDAGNVRVNSGSVAFGSDLPWGGFKASGFGKEGSRYGLEEFTRLKLICVDTSI
jgi:acyl-CoA reductase-like NAD-dependent aldehyde dehydrogenase